MQVGARLLMHGQHVCPRSRELGHVALGVLDHQVNVQQGAGAVHERLEVPAPRRARA